MAILPVVNSKYVPAITSNTAIKNKKMACKGDFVRMAIAYPTPKDNTPAIDIRTLVFGSLCPISPPFNSSMGFDSFIFNKLDSRIRTNTAENRTIAEDTPFGIPKIKGTENCRRLVEASKPAGHQILQLSPRAMLPIPVMTVSQKSTGNMPFSIPRML